MSISDDRATQDIEKLYDALQSIGKEQNQVQLSEFYQYADLFSNHDGKMISNEYIGRLSKAFAQRFDLYQPIEVYEGNELLFKVPQIFIPINDVSADYQKYVDKFRSDGVSDVPRYATEATAGLLAAILKSQENVSNHGYETYGEYVKSLSEDYVSSVKAFNTMKKGNIEKVVQKVAQQDKSFDLDIDGISWK